jgi:hypothetical protein
VNPEQGVPAGKIRALFGLGRKTLEYLTVQKQYVEASIAEAQGRGSSRLYSLVDVYRIGFLEQLRHHGVEYPRAAALMAHVPLFLNSFHSQTVEALPRLLVDYQRLLLEQAEEVSGDPSDLSLRQRPAYNPFEAHSLPPLDYILGILHREGEQKGLTLELADDRRRYGPFAPYAILEPNPVDPEGWHMTIPSVAPPGDPESIETFSQRSISCLSINLSALSRAIQTGLRL